MAEKTLHAVYDDDDKLLAAVKKIKEANIDIEEVYTPFPVHGLDKVMGLKETRWLSQHLFMVVLGLVLQYG